MTHSYYNPFICPLVLMHTRPKVAYLGAICESKRGFGVSASMKGNFLSMDSAAVWDMVVVMHEFGM